MVNKDALKAADMQALNAHAMSKVLTSNLEDYVVALQNGVLAVDHIEKVQNVMTSVTLFMESSVNEYIKSLHSR